MHLKMTGTLLASMLLSMTGCAGGADDTQTSDSLHTQESAAQQCLNQFDGITSCALGQAKLATVKEGLAVSGLLAKTDGVASTFPKAVKWEQRTAVSLGQTGGLQLAARDADQVVSTLRITPGREANTVNMAPTFTGTPGGSRYTMNIYRGGVLVTSSPQPAGMMITFTNWRDFLRWAEMHAWFLNDFDIDMHSRTAAADVGACVWRVRAENTTFTATVDGKSIVGDEVAFVETIADGAYPYRHFTGIDVNAVASQFTIRSESITLPEGAK
ncbi:hypothetical protein [Corallococcus sp. CA053C]|uniref:hypothetical protein n=1 Tax=Corallococcus sp. CA053C TaxID=2316732 RepID=UPI001F41473A|nr:hypothetical protein [Corallococcus sp. CA053C]